VAQVQNCYDMGYKLIYNAIKTIDGEKVEESTAVVPLQCMHKTQINSSICYMERQINMYEYVVEMKGISKSFPAQRRWTMLHCS